MKGGLWSKIKRVAITDVAVLVKGIDADALEEMERLLVESDFGSVAFDIVTGLENQIRAGVLRSEESMRAWLTDEVARLATVSGHADGLDLGDGKGPGVVLLVGVNGVGKTTQAAKLAKLLLGQGKSVLLAAADTFRAGAREQLGKWAERLAVEFVSGSPGGDPAAVVFDAITAAEARAVDAVLVDTGGRLHTRGDLMEELRKMVRVAGRQREGAPHEILLVMDGTVGQNAVRQGREFGAAIPLTGIIVTKLDGTAKGGAVVSAAKELGVPVRFVGVGETVDDLEPFDPGLFAQALMGD